MKLLDKSLLAAIVAGFVFIGVNVATIHQGTSQETQRPLKKDETTLEVTQGSIEDVVTAQGTLEPKDYVDVGAQVSGQIKKLHVEIGDAVKTGDLLAEIDPQTYETRVAGDMANIKTLSAQKAEKEAEIELANTKLERNRTLFAENAVSREALEETETALKVAKAQLGSIKAQMEQAQSTLAGNKVNLGYTRIYAPMDGTIVAQSIKEGQTINASQTAPIIVQVANLQVMTVRAEVAEADVMRLKQGMNAYFTTLGSQGRKWQGVVRQILPSPETVNDVVLYNVLVDVDNADGSLMTGMTTQNFFVLGSAENTPLVPVAALGRRIPEQDTDAGKAYEVMKVGGESATPAVVLVGIMDRKNAAVLEGLASGDRVLPAVTQSTRGTQTQGGPRMGPRL